MKYTSNEIQAADGIPEVEADVQTLPEAIAGSVRTYTPLQMQYLGRLQRLKEVKANIESLPDQDPFMKKLVGRGLFATYSECVDESVGPEARHILGI
jgi:hypothetical protein